MADNQELSQFGNFSIEDTMNMGMGSSELLNDLMSPETASSSPDDVTVIKDEPPAPKKAAKAPEAPKEEAHHNLQLYQMTCLNWECLIRMKMKKMLRLHLLKNSLKGST